MIKHLKIILLIALCLGYTFVAQAQKIVKEGVAIYSVEYDLPAEQQAMAGMLPKEFKVAFKGNYSMFKMDMGMFATSVILNNLTNETLTLTDVPMQNKKFAVKMSKAEAEKMQGVQPGQEDYKVTKTTETKKIAGYNCTKYLLKDETEDTDIELWATDEIQIPANALTSAIKGIKGVPIAFSTNTGGLKSKLTLKSISEEPVAEINFNIPAGYELMDFKDLMGQMGG
ncbi:MAG TPA: DUF4412 domain-containing protein [Pelobium sp.]|nr:DUF4412 domain-containing protein [Pelobium sp.]